MVGKLYNLQYQCPDFATTLALTFIQQQISNSYYVLGFNLGSGNTIVNKRKTVLMECTLPWFVQNTLRYIM